MPDTPVPPDLPTRVAVLEEIADVTKTMLAELRADARTLRAEVQNATGELRTEMLELRREARTDFRWLFGLGLSATVALLFVMARGFGWFH